MSYYEDVYLPRINRFGTTKQERILGKRIFNFDSFLEKRSLYKVTFTVNFQEYIGALEPGKRDEKDIVSYLLVPLALTFETGTVLVANNRSWIILLHDQDMTKGYNRYKVCLLDRTVTWWDINKVVHTAPINFNSTLTAIVSDTYRENKAAPIFREMQNYSHFIMAFDVDLQQDNYLKINGSDRRFIVTGYDCETIPGVQYVTVDITLARDDTQETVVSTSYWEGET